MIPRETLKVNLKRFRFDADSMTQQELARRVGVTRQTVLSIESGRYRPSLELALRMARVFRVPVEAIFEIVEEE